MEVELINIVSFGGGTNSAAMLVGLHQHGIPVDLILFADTGAEQPHTYCFIETIILVFNFVNLLFFAILSDSLKTYADGRKAAVECHSLVLC